MSERTSELMRLCFEKVDLEGPDAAFYQNVMNCILEARAESEAQGRREEAQVWFDKWGQLLDRVWASNRLAELQQLVENTSGNVVMMALTKEWAEDILHVADDDKRRPLIEAQHRGVSLAHLKQMATAWLQREGS